MAPSLVLSCIHRLPDTSLTHALMQGHRDHFGWGQDRHLLADIYDAINTNTKYTGNWKKPPKIPVWPRPSSKSREAKKPATVKDLWARFAGLRGAVASEEV